MAAPKAKRNYEQAAPESQWRIVAPPGEIHPETHPITPPFT